MKNVLVAALVVVVAYFAWRHFNTLTIDGPEVPESSRVAFVPGEEFTSVADHLNADQWTVLLFSSSSAPGGRDVERQFEIAVRERVKNVRLVIVDVGSLSSPAAKSVDLKELPTAWLFDGVAKKSTDFEKILETLK